MKYEYEGDELSLFAHAINWKQYWVSKVAPLIRGSVLEVGAGIGSVTQILSNINPNRYLALEPDENLCKQILQAQEKYRIPKQVQIICGNISMLSTKERFDTILYIDVLEHIKYDSKELLNALELLNQSGSIIVLSPAHQFLFSPFDQSIGHHRRYDRKMLKEICPTGMKISKCFYLDSVGFFASLVNSKLMKSQMPTTKQILFWDRVLIPLSRIIDTILLFNFGKTIVAVYQKE